MLYYKTDQNRSKWIGVAAALLYLLFWVVLMLIVKFEFEKRDSGGEGLLVSFGDVDSAAGVGIPEDGISIPDWTAPSANEQGEVITQDFEDAPTVLEDDGREQRQNRDNQQTAQEPERIADPRLNFPGTTQGAASSSSGTATTGAGHQGRVDGALDGSPDGTGSGSGGVGFDLTGRRVLGSLTKPQYKEGNEGMVVVEVIVRADGTVRSARRVNSNKDTKQPSKRIYTTTINDSRLIEEAIKEAKRSKFDRLEGSDTEQIGWVLYTFNLN